MSLVTAVCGELSLEAIVQNAILSSPDRLLLVQVQISNVTSIKSLSVHAYLFTSHNDKYEFCSEQSKKALHPACCYATTIRGDVLVLWYVKSEGK